MPPELYAHIWEGAYYKHTEAQVFKGCYDVREFKPGADWDGPYFGIDFGFAQDPTTAVKVWIHDKRIYIEHEAAKVGLELDHTADYIKRRVPDIESHISRADSARPESISYLKRHGLPKIRGVEKGKGSVEDGIEFMRSRGVTIHPRCTETIKEFLYYSYKVDRLTGDILPQVIDKHNHLVDGTRYAIAPLIKKRAGVYIG
jgi:phage terminase large subunit